MKTLVCIEVEHRDQLPHLADMVAGRAWSINGVTKAEVTKLPPLNADQLEALGFSLAEIALGAGEVVR